MGSGRSKKYVTETDEVQDEERRHAKGNRTKKVIERKITKKY